jgi:predicted TIM-barrel enzyme
MIAMARELDLYTTCYVRTPDESRRMAAAGVDLVVPHVGLTTGGTIGATDALTLEQAAASTQAMIRAAREVSPTIIALAHGGPIAEPDDVAYILAHTDAQGFVGASSMERLPVERAIVQVVKDFKKLTLR